MIKWLTSMKTALAIMLLLIVSSILATFFPNFNVYQTLWYRGLLLFLCINLLFCTGKSLPALVKNLKTIPIPSQNNFKSGKRHKVKNSADFVTTIKDVLQLQNYVVKTEQTEQVTVISAHKGVLNHLAPHLLHISLIVIFIGALTYSFGANENVYCYVGDTVKLPKQILPDVTLKVDDFVTLYDNNDSVDNWQSKITLLKNDTKLITDSLKVNHPLKYNNVKFYQSGYGYDHQLKITGENAGQYSLPTGESFKLADRNFRIVLKNKTFVMNISDGFVEQEVSLRAGQTIDFPNNTKVTYQKLKPYTILNVKRAPGGPVIMFGLVIMSISSLFFWSPPYRRVNIFVYQDKTAQFNVFSKHKEVKEQLTNQIMQSS